MKLSQIKQNSIESFFYLERKVNNGLPGGLHFINNTSLETNPWLCDKIALDVVDLPFGCIKMGETNNKIASLIGENEIIIHPDFSDVIEGLGYSVKRNHLKGIPTSSSRTIYIQECDSFIKLSYPGIIGRVDKSLIYDDLVSSFENTEILSKIVRNNTVPYLQFFPEKHNRYSNEIGYSFIERCGLKYIMEKANRNIYIIPAFSLFGTDQDYPLDASLACQLIDLRCGVGKDIFSKLIVPIIDTYLKLLFVEGLQLELHAQNFVLLFDENWELINIVLRDIDSIQRDITIQKENNKTYSISNYPNRCVESTQADYIYKHSFMFDHKFGEFFLKELIDDISYHDKRKVKIYEEKIKKYCNTHYGDFFKKYFPTNKWYKFDDIIIDPSISRRIYSEQMPTIYR